MEKDEYVLTTYATVAGDFIDGDGVWGRSLTHESTRCLDPPSGEEDEEEEEEEAEEEEKSEPEGDASAATVAALNEEVDAFVAFCVQRLWWVVRWFADGDVDIASRLYWNTFNRYYETGKPFGSIRVDAKGNGSIKFTVGWPKMTRARRTVLAARLDQAAYIGALYQQFAPLGWHVAFDADRGDDGSSFFTIPVVLVPVRRLPSAPARVPEDATLHAAMWLKALADREATTPNGFESNWTLYADILSDLCLYLKYTRDDTVGVCSSTCEMFTSHVALNEAFRPMIAACVGSVPGISFC